MNDYIEHEALRDLKAAGCIMLIILAAVFACGFAVGRWA